MVTKHSEAVFEHGLLRPLQPLDLDEQQHVMLTISEVQAPKEVTVSPKESRLAELEWLSQHSEEYAGQWVALDGDTLLSHGSDAFAVRDEARANGVDLPLMVHIQDEPNAPSIGWL